MLKFNSIILALLLATLSLTIFGCTSSTSTTVDELNLKIAKLEKEIEDIEDIEEYHSKSYLVRSHLDIESRKVYKAFENKDIDTLKEMTTKDTVFLSDEVIFNYDNSMSDIKFNSFGGSLTLRQRWYDLSLDYETFMTGYEIIREGVEFIPVINFTFVIEDGQWKLCFITTE